MVCLWLLPLWMGFRSWCGMGRPGGWCRLLIRWRLLMELNSFCKISVCVWKWETPGSNLCLQNTTPAAIRLNCLGSLRLIWVEVRQQAVATPLRIEFPGAVYHLSLRGDRREPRRWASRFSFGAKSTVFKNGVQRRNIYEEGVLT